MQILYTSNLLQRVFAEKILSLSSKKPHKNIYDCESWPSNFTKFLSGNNKQKSIRFCGLLRGFYFSHLTSEKAKNRRESAIFNVA